MSKRILTPPVLKKIFGFLLFGSILLNAYFVKSAGSFLFDSKAVSPSISGELILTTQPPIYYNQLLHFVYTMTKRARYPNLTIWCTQDDKVAFISEKFLTRDLEGTYDFIISNDSNHMPGYNFDYTKPANCVAYIVDDNKPQIRWITRLSPSWTVNPVNP